MIGACSTMVLRIGDTAVTTCRRMMRRLALVPARRAVNLVARRVLVIPIVAIVSVGGTDLPESSAKNCNNQNRTHFSSLRQAGPETAVPLRCLRRLNVFPTKVLLLAAKYLLFPANEVK
jgi:hypothetical protein